MIINGVTIDATFAEVYIKLVLSAHLRGIALSVGVL